MAYEARTIGLTAPPDSRSLHLGLRNKLAMARLPRWISVVMSMRTFAEKMELSDGPRLRGVDRGARIAREETDRGVRIARRSR